MPGFRPTSLHVHPGVEHAYRSLETLARGGRKPEAAVWKSFLHARERIRSDGQWGEVVPQIPAYFVDRYGARNLYCIDLAGFRRALYTIEGRGIVFLDLVDHTAYDRLFGRQGRR